MPFCRTCGKEIDENAKFCPFCGVTQAYVSTQQPSEKEKVVSVKPLPIISSTVKTVVVLSILIGVLIFAATAEVFDCPACGGSPIRKWTCSHCSYDGKATLIQYITYYLDST